MPSPIPLSSSDPPTTVAVTFGPSAAILRGAAGGFQGPVRLCVFDAANPERQRWFAGAQLALGELWDGRLYTYLAPASADALPQQDPNSPEYYVASGGSVGMTAVVFTQDELLEDPQQPTTPTAYPNARYDFDYAAFSGGLAPGNGLVVYTPLEQVQ